MNGDSANAQSAVTTLRSAGPDGLEALITTHETLFQDKQNPNYPKLIEAIKDVGAQRSCLSQLYWYTDLEKAKAAALKSKKPILTLRMLGNLTDEYSCANSRFFRTTLYSNPKIAALLKENFVLHWKSVRPIPVITIDFGDGRTLKRTVTGNSAHYVLDYRGRVVDALPGLYGPEAFAKHINNMASMAKMLGPIAEQDQFAKGLQNLQQAILMQSNEDLAKDLKKIGYKPEAPKPAFPIQAANPPAKAVPAELAAVRAVGKAIVEQPLITAFLPAPPVHNTAKGLQPHHWDAIAALYKKDARLDPVARMIMVKENPPAASVAARVAAPKQAAEHPLIAMIEKMENSIALDTVRNEYLLRSQIRSWFLANPTQDLAALNKRVYAELFLTPDSDPWLGLVPPDTYTGLEGGGLSVVAN